MLDTLIFYAVEFDAFIICKEKVTGTRRESWIEYFKLLIFFLFMFMLWGHSPAVVNRFSLL